MNPQQYYQNNQNAPQMIVPNQNGVSMQSGAPAAQPMPQQAPQVIMPNQGNVPAVVQAGPQMVMPGQQQVQMQQQVPMQQQAPMQQRTVANGQPAQSVPQNANAASLGATAMAAQQANPNSATKEVPTSTQATLLISELRDNVVIMKDGSFRAVVACKSINFDLMSEMEREGVEYSYQNFLNSLKFTTQILIRSQRVDIGPYIDKLSEIRRNNDNMLLGVLMDDYINFIDILSQEANIMDKSFFIVIPYYTSEDTEKSMEQTKNFFKTFSRAKGPEVTRIDRATYDKALSELTNRVDSVMSGLFQIGIHSTRLNTKELAELYYNFNNPDTAVREPLVDFSKLATMYVKKGEKNG